MNITLPRPRTVSGPLTREQYQAVRQAAPFKLPDDYGYLARNYGEGRAALELTGKMSHSNIDYYRREGYDIISFEETMAALGKPVEPAPKKDDLTKPSSAEVDNKSWHGKEMKNDEVILIRNESEFKLLMSDSGRCPFSTFSKNELYYWSTGNGGWNRREKPSECNGRLKILSIHEFTGITPPTKTEPPSPPTLPTPPTPSKKENMTKHQHNYKMGDPIRIISKPPSERHCGLDRFVEDMDKFCGRVSTIRRVYPSGMIILKEIGFSWHHSWLEPVTPVVPPTVIIPEIEKAVSPFSDLVPVFQVSTNLRPKESQMFRYVRLSMKATLFAVAIYVLGFLVSFGKQQYDVVTQAASWPAPATNFAVQTSKEATQNTLEMAEGVGWGNIGIYVASILSIIIGVWTTFRSVKRNQERDSQMKEILKALKKA